LVISASRVGGAAYAAPPFFAVFAAFFEEVLAFRVGFRFAVFPFAFGAHFAGFGLGCCFGLAETPYRAAALIKRLCGGSPSSE
jgi:hypothetical protein